MLVDQTKSNILVIPILAKDGIAVDKVILQPGINDIPDDQWKAARVHIESKIKSGEVEELYAKVEKKKVTKTVGEDPETKKPIKEEVEEIVITATEFRKLSIDKAIKVVKRTVSLETLQKWNKKEGRDSVKAEIMNRIDLVEKYGEEKKEKLKDKDENK